MLLFTTGTLYTIRDDKSKSLDHVHDISSKVTSEKFNFKSNWHQYCYLR